jgi:hypothetical protein
MRIYEVNIEHKTYGMNWRSVKVAAKTAEEAIRAAKRDFNTRERVESVELLAHAD